MSEEMTITDLRTGVVIWPSYNVQKTISLLFSMFPSCTLALYSQEDGTLEVTLIE